MAHFNDEVTSAAKGQAIEFDNASRSSASNDSQASKRRRRAKRRKRQAAASDIASQSSNSDGSSKRKKNKRKKAANGMHKSAFDQRRDSLSQGPRDPRDLTRKKPKPAPEVEVVQEAPTPTPSESRIVEEDFLSRPAKGTRARREETDEEANARFEEMRGAVRTILRCVGEDPDREGLLDTPKRYAKALLEFTRGYQINVEDVVKQAIFEENHNEMVIVRDIEIFSMCEHHMVPFTGKMHIGYIPRGKVIGLSKLPRIAEMFARRLQVQERLTKEVAQAIMTILKPQGVVVVMESSHLCMVMRGVQKTTATTITSCVLGCFESKSKTRSEFFSLLGRRY